MEALKGLYHADKLDEESFIRNFTIRLKEFAQIVDNLHKQKKKPLQHFLIVGKRGMGKSTLLRRIHIDASAKPLSEKLYAVRLATEQYRLSRLFKLWEMVIEHLGNREPELKEQKKQLESSRNYEENLLLIIKEFLHNTGKTLLLLIDNFDQFIDKIPVKDQHALREALMLYPIQIIGNAVFYDEHFKGYGSPFFDFFKPIPLRNLDKEEAEEFIKIRAINEGIQHIDEILRNQRGKISALRILSGGVPRTLLILLSIVSKKNTGDAIDYLHEMIEQVTPLYQDRMKVLSPQQQEIMHHLAMRWDRTPVKDLAADMKIPSKSISAQLIQLESIGYIRKIDVPGRNHLYEIDERFFNIWLLMSEVAPYDAQRVVWLTKWLDAFYSRSEIRNFASFCQTGLKELNPGNRFLIAQALAGSQKLEARYKTELIKETVEDLREKISEVQIWADVVQKKLHHEQTLLVTEIEQYIGRKEYSEAYKRLQILSKANPTLALAGFGLLYSEQGDIKNAERYYLKGVKAGSVSAMYNLAILYMNEKGDIAAAGKYYEMAAENGHVKAMYNLGSLNYNEKKDMIAAEKYYRQAIEKGHVAAMNNLAILYQNEKNDIEGAEKYYQMAVDKGDANAMNNLGVLYYRSKGDLENAARYYLMAVEAGSTEALKNLAILHLSKKDLEGAEKYYRMAVDKGDVRAMNNLGALYYNTKGDAESAEKYYLMAVQKGDVVAMVRLATLYQEKKRDVAGAEKYLRMAADKGDANAMFNLALLYWKEKEDMAVAEKYLLMAAGGGEVDAMYNLGILYQIEKDIDRAESYYRMAIGKGHAPSMNKLGALYKNEKNDVTGAEKYYLMAVEKGNSDAMNNLAVLYESQHKDVETVEKYFLMAVDKGNLEALHNVALLYHTAKSDIKSAEYYYKKAIEKGDTDAMNNLGMLCRYERNDISEAEKYFQMAAESGHAEAMANLALLYFESNAATKKENACQLSVRALEASKSQKVLFQSVHIRMALWNEKVSEAGKLLRGLLAENFDSGDDVILISQILQYFLVFHQKHFLYNLFISDTRRIDRYKPVYYALMHEMQNEHPKEYLKMPAELDEPVKDILESVHKEQQRLGV